MASYVTYKVKENVSGLIKGHIYEVSNEIIKRGKVYFVVRGIKGEFSADLFETYLENPNVKMGYGNYSPIEGHSYKCIIFSEGKIQIISTSRVKQVEELFENTFKIITQNTIYVIYLKI